VNQTAISAADRAAMAAAAIRSGRFARPLRGDGDGALLGR
jgi:hypothetical protein